MGRHLLDGSVQRIQFAVESFEFVCHKAVLGVNNLADVLRLSSCRQLFVADAFADDLYIKLGERQQNVERKSPTVCWRRKVAHVIAVPFANFDVGSSASLKYDCGLDFGW
jgi:hypothetical protein